MHHTVFLNGQTVKNLDIKGLLFYPIHLQIGNNNLFVKIRGNGNDHSFKTILYDPTSAAHLYAERHNGSIINPIINNDSIKLTNAHWMASKAPIRIMIHDVYGEKLYETILKKDVTHYQINGLKNNMSYLCTMVIEGDSVHQPIIYGTLEGVEKKFSTLRSSLPNNHPRASEIDQLLYRAKKLLSLSGRMRSEAWFPYKMPWVTYQLEHTFAHLNVSYGNDNNESGIHFITYSSPLDNGLQRYILATPNKVDKSRKYPLIIIMRPENERHYHLFFSPQIAHQYVVNDLQMKAEKYNCFIAMPEVRMLLKEDMIPFADAEMNYFMKHLQNHYNIDCHRIYLNANCTGGYRALKYAGMHPDLFAAISLYAPVYSMEGNLNYSQTKTPQILLSNLKTTPIYIHGDPADFHSGIKLYKQLILDCENMNIPYTLSLQRNTGQGMYGYHRMLIGDDACQFLLSKKIITKKQNYFKIGKNIEIVDFYSQPFKYVYNSADTSYVYNQLLNSIRNEYETHLYSTLPLIPDTLVSEKMLHDYNIFLIGDNYTNPLVHQFIQNVKKQNSLTPTENITLQVLTHPINSNKMTLLYSNDKNVPFYHCINFPWIYGFSNIINR